MSSVHTRWVGRPSRGFLSEPFTEAGPHTAREMASGPGPKSLPGAEAQLPQRSSGEPGAVQFLDASRASAGVPAAAEGPRRAGVGARMCEGTSVSRKRLASRL